MTDSETTLWRHLRAHRLNGEKFRRQQPIGRYVVDFVHFGARLIVEADGGQHNRSAADERRDTWLRAQGFTVMRFWNNEIMQNLAGVLETIMAAVSELSAQAAAPARAPALPPSPPPLSREGRGEQSNHMSSTPNAEEEFASHISPSPLAGEGLGRGGQSHQNSPSPLAEAELTSHISPSPLAGEGLGRGGQSHQNSTSPLAGDEFASHISPSHLAGEGLGRGEGVVAATTAQLTAKDSS
jgi:very-short-patch-repair endonuclease